jgi:hypothetical protein
MRAGLLQCEQTKGADNSQTNQRDNKQNDPAAQLDVAMSKSITGF